MTVTTLPSRSKLGVELCIKSCLKEPKIDWSDIKHPDNVVVEAENGYLERKGMWKMVQVNTKQITFRMELDPECKHRSTDSTIVAETQNGKFECFKCEEFYK